MLFSNFHPLRTSSFVLAIESPGRDQGWDRRRTGGRGLVHVAPTPGLRQLVDRSGSGTFCGGSNLYIYIHTYTHTHIYICIIYMYYLVGG